uniref:Putative ovule protein n=1 Tax=Solanum chacoense TaxID=4108 RepID=A0A0V0H288_SOLCH
MVIHHLLQVVIVLWKNYNLLFKLQLLIARNLVLQWKTRKSRFHHHEVKRASRYTTAPAMCGIQESIEPKGSIGISARGYFHGVNLRPPDLREFDHFYPLWYYLFISSIVKFLFLILCVS